MEQDVKVFQLQLYLKPRISDPAVITVNAGKDTKRIIAGAYGIKKSKQETEEGVNMGAGGKFYSLT
jgi:hypothetical protein